MSATDVLSIRFEKGTKTRLERLRQDLEKQTGMKIKRAAVIRTALEEGLKVMERKAGK